VGDPQQNIHFAHSERSIRLATSSFLQVTMRRSTLFVFVTAVQILVACSKPDQLPPIQLILHSKNECELVFKSHNALVVENFCDVEQKPILIKLIDQEIRSNWIEEKTSRFLFQEGCAQANECFYELSTNDAGVRGRFSYRINMTEGEYSFEVDMSGQSKVFKHSSRRFQVG
jgi:hypothetical protein